MKALENLRGKKYFYGHSIGHIDGLDVMSKDDFDNEMDNSILIQYHHNAISFEFHETASKVEIIGVFISVILSLLSSNRMASKTLRRLAHSIGVKPKIVNRAKTNHIIKSYGGDSGIS